MRYFVFVVALLLTPSMVEATLKPTDFAYGIPLSLEGNGAVYRLSVPREVYDTVTRDDLADIRIFNSADAVVPHIVRRPKKTIKVSEYSKTLPFFPLYGGENLLGKEGLSVRIEKSGKQTMIDVLSDDAEFRKDPKLSGYIIDAGRYRERIHELKITWQEKEGNFVGTVSVECSNDMTHWAALVPRATLARMQYRGHEIKREKIRMPATTATYYRLKWPADSEGIEVKEIHAIHRSGQPERERQWTALKGDPGPDDEKTGITAYEYESPARLPVDRVRLRFSEKNTLVKATIFSRPDREATWRYRQSGIFYHLSFEQTTLVQDTVSVGQSSDRYWRVAIEEGATGDLENIPIVELGWLPYELLFVARGEGPFMLAYGSARLGEEEWNSGTNRSLAQVMGGNKDKLLKEAVLLSKTVLGGPDLLVPELVVGVGIIAKMALGLGKGMNKENSG
jgi:hypothetical protein